MTAQSRHIVILDTNTLYGDPTLRSGALNQLIRACRVVRLPIFFPEVVILELVEQYKSTTQTRYQAALTAVKELNRYIYSGTPREIIDGVHSLVEHYESWLRSRLAELGIGVLDIPKISQQAVVQRATQKRRPFMGRDRSSDRGYKDAIIWETVLECITNTTNKIILITHDQGFYEKDELHRDLLEDLERGGHSADDVTLRSNYESAIEYLNDLYGVQNAFQEEKWSQVTKEALAQEIPFAELLDREKDSIKEELEEDKSVFTMASAPVEVYFPSTVEPSSVDFDAEYVGDGEWRIHGEALWDANVEYYDDEPPHGNKSEDMILSIEFTIYYDYENKEMAHRTIIDGVRRTD